MEEELIFIEVSRVLHEQDAPWTGLRELFELLIVVSVTYNYVQEPRTMHVLSYLLFVFVGVDVYVFTLQILVFMVSERHKYVEVALSIPMTG